MRLRSLCLFVAATILAGTAHANDLVGKWVSRDNMLTISLASDGHFIGKMYMAVAGPQNPTEMLFTKKGGGKFTGTIEHTQFWVSAHLVNATHLTLKGMFFKPLAFHRVPLNYKWP